MVGPEEMGLGRHGDGRLTGAQVCQVAARVGFALGKRWGAGRRGKRGAKQRQAQSAHSHPAARSDVGEVQGRLGGGREHLEDAVAAQDFQSAGRPPAGLQLDICGHKRRGNGSCGCRRLRGRAGRDQRPLCRLSGHGIRGIRRWSIVGRGGRAGPQPVRPTCTPMWSAVIAGQHSTTESSDSFRNFPRTTPLPPGSEPVAAKRT